MRLGNYEIFGPHCRAKVITRPNPSGGVIIDEVHIWVPSVRPPARYPGELWGGEAHPDNETAGSVVSKDLNGTPVTVM